MAGWNSKTLHVHRMRDMAAGHANAMQEKIDATVLRQPLPKIDEPVPGCTYIDTRPSPEPGHVVIQYCAGPEILTQRVVRATRGPIGRVSRWAARHKVAFTPPGESGHEADGWE
jgi:hypothetical protein